MPILEHPVRPNSSTQWASTDVNNGENSTANKIATTEYHKQYGFSYPEQPPRNIWNYWCNAVYRVINYLTNYYDIRLKTVAENGAYSVADIVGLTIRIDNQTSLNMSMRVQSGSKVDTVTPIVTLTVPDNTTSFIYAQNTSTNTVELFASAAEPVESVQTSWMPLYRVIAVAGNITSVEDIRCPALVRKATIADVSSGVDNTSFITPYVLKLGYLISQATTVIFGTVRLADSTDVDNQSGDDVLTAGSLYLSQIRAASDGTKAGTVLLASNTTLGSRGANGANVLTVGNLADSNMYSSESLPGVVTKCTLAEALAGVENTKFVPPNLIPDVFSDVIPTGVVTMWVNTATPPSGWLWCDGSTIPNSGDTANLYAHISALNADIGLPAGQLPDLRGEFVRGWINDKTTISGETGRKVGSFENGTLIQHSHQFYDKSTSGSYGAHGGGNGFGTSGISRTTTSTGGSETRPLNISLNYIIKK